MQLDCAACGEEQRTDQSCAHDLVAQKETGFVCALYGGSNVYCVGGEAEWNPVFETPLDLGAPTSSIAVEADISAAICFVQNGSIGCTQTYSPETVNDCSRVAIDQGALCSLCDGHMSCTDSAQTEVDDVRTMVISDSFVTWLTMDGSIESALGSPLMPGSYVHLDVDDEIRACGVRQDGALVCATSGGNNAAFLEQPGDYIQVSAGYAGRRCALTAGGEVDCFEFSDQGFSPAFSPEGSSFVQVVSASDKSCALSRAGKVQCWDTDVLSFDFGPFE
jgi:hypothetical protein